MYAADHGDRARLVNARSTGKRMMGRIFGVMPVSWISNVVSFFSWYSIVLMRYRFGERRFGLIWIVSGFVFTFLYQKIFLFVRDMIFGGGLISSIVGAGLQMFGSVSRHAPVNQSSMLLKIHAYAFLILGVIHYVSILKRNIKGEKWHSRSTGISRLYNLYRKQRSRLPERFRNFKDYHFMMYVEPLFVFSLGFLVMRIDDVYGWFLIFSSAGVFYKEQIARHETRRRLLDYVDAEIENERLISASKGEEVEHAGITLYGAIPVKLNKYAEETTQANYLDDLNPAMGVEELGQQFGLDED